MKKILILWFSLLPAVLFSQDFFGEADLFFKQHVSEGSVDYEGIKRDPDKLRGLIEQVESFSIGKQNANFQMAFYLNAYNLMVINGIVSKYPVSSPMEISGFFDQKTITVAGEKMSLNDLENKKVRVYNDARIHFALVCAAKGCPILISESYDPERVQDQLQKVTEDAMNDPQFIRYGRNAGEVEVSQIFNWYASDFGGEKGVVPFINQYRKEKIPEGARVSYYEYDWTLNEKK